MAVAYVDTSCIVAAAFIETSAGAVTRRLREFTELVASNLLEAELRAALVRQRITLQPDDTPFFSMISWVVPTRPLHVEIAQVLAAGYVRGADCWHLATALYAADIPSSLSFLTLDVRQREVASALGFAT